MSGPYANEVLVPLVDEVGRIRGQVRIVSPGGSALAELSAAEAREWGEERVQLTENGEYDYELQLREGVGGLRCPVVRRSRLSDANIERGRILPRGHTGLLVLYLVDNRDRTIASAGVEVRSVKVGYRSDYRSMLNFIAERSTDLLLRLPAPAFVRLRPVGAAEPKTIAQRFAFARYVVRSDAFRNAIARIIAAPHERTVRELQSTDVRGGFATSAGAMRQLASRHPRIPVPEGHALRRRLPSLPLQILRPRSGAGYDTPENRFVKFVLDELDNFFSSMERALAGVRTVEAIRLASEVAVLRNDIAALASHEFFRRIGDLQELPLGSSVLQGRSGYRELLQAWLRFNLAAALDWDGGEDVYGAGKRDVATLYEYWLFFKLLDLFVTKFRLPDTTISSLLERSSDSFCIRLKRGSHTAVEGTYSTYGRSLRVRFSFNRTFKRDGPLSANYPAAGSWTRTMRPDYTLTIWPDAFSERESEEQELVVHLHFDAKYRIETLAELFGDDALERPDAASVQEAETVKRTDLLKMHAYRDAIRRTAGAYVLYPGDENVMWRGYHEILPGVGAFAVTPSNNSGFEALSTFIDDVVLNLTDRASQREAYSYNVYRIHNAMPLREGWRRKSPERGSDGKRVVPASEQLVLAAFCESDELSQRCLEHLTYGFKIERGMTLAPEYGSVSFALLYSPEHAASARLMGVVPGFSVVSGEVYAAMLGGEERTDGLYVIYRLVTEIGLLSWRWSVAAFANEALWPAPAIPRIIRLSHLQTLAL